MPRFAKVLFGAFSLVQCDLSIPKGNPMSNQNENLADARLIEKLTETLMSHEELKLLLTNLATAQNQLVLKIDGIGIQQQHRDEKLNRLFVLTDDHTAKLVKQEQTLGLHTFIWKLIGTVSVTAIGLVGWGYTTLGGLNSTDSAHDRRLTILEYIASSKPNATVQPPTK